MRLRGRGAPILTCAVALAVAGCGTSAPTQMHKPAVAVTISTPTSGATLGVRQVTVTGTVVPAGAHVMVGGQPAQVSGSNFTRTVELTAPQQVLTVTAQADGYAPAQTDATVSYSSALAAQMTAANHSMHTLDAGAQAVPAALSSSSAGAGTLAQAVSLGNGSSSLPRSSAHTASRTTPAGSSHLTPTPGTSSPPLSPTPPASSPVTPSPVTTTPAPLTPSPQSVTERIRKVWEGNCLQKIKGSKVVAYCTCIYTHLEQTGAFRTPGSVRGLVGRVNYWVRTGDRSHLSHAIITALAVCQSRFPSEQSTNGPSGVTPLSGTSHLPVPAKPIPSLPLSGTGTTPTPIPVPVSPN